MSTLIRYVREKFHTSNLCNHYDPLITRVVLIIPTSLVFFHVRYLTKVKLYVVLDLRSVINFCNFQIPFFTFWMAEKQKFKKNMISVDEYISRTSLVKTLNRCFESTIEPEEVLSSGSLRTNINEYNLIF